MEGCRKARKKERRESGLEGYRKGFFKTEGMRNRRDAGYFKGDRKGGMQDWMDARKEGCRKGRDEGKEVCRKGDIQERRGANLILK